jgi:hypothetical protein
LRLVLKRPIHPCHICFSSKYNFIMLSANSTEQRHGVVCQKISSVPQLCCEKVSCPLV